MININFLWTHFYLLYNFLDSLIYIDILVDVLSAVPKALIICYQYGRILVCPPRRAPACSTVAYSCALNCPSFIVTIEYSESTQLAICSPS